MNGSKSLKLKAVDKSKFHVLKEKIESKYDGIHERLTSKFHKRNIFEFVNSYQRHKPFNKYIDQPVALHIEDSITKESQRSINPENKFKQNIDWTRGRFAGQVISIVIEDGVIIEKVFVTPRGSLINVKRNNLGILINHGKALNR